MGSPLVTRYDVLPRVHKRFDLKFDSFMFLATGKLVRKNDWKYFNRIGNI